MQAFSSVRAKARARVPLCVCGEFNFSDGGVKKKKGPGCKKKKNPNPVRIPLKVLTFITLISDPGLGLCVNASVLFTSLSLSLSTA